MKSINKIYQELRLKSVSNADNYSVATLPMIKNHKIGISQQELPLFFIKCDNVEKVKCLDYNLEFITVRYNCTCDLIGNKNKVEKGVYTIISLKTESLDIQEYFLNIVYLIIKNLPQLPSLSSLKIEVEKLINLFSRFSNPPIKTIQGLWAELLLIEQSSNPEYLIQSWHCTTNDKFDFNDGKDKIEVKSTSKNRRIHSFSIEQLNPNFNSNLLIVSIFAIKSGMGKNVLDMISLIEKRIKKNELIFKLNEIIAQTLGNDFEKIFEVNFDYQYGVDNIKYYNFKSIPTIQINHIPKEVTNVKFESDLTDIKNIEDWDKKSDLIYSLFINIDKK